jgi:hypothetical protein
MLLKPINPGSETPQQLEYICLVCGDHSLFEDLAEKAVDLCFEFVAYVAMTDGGDQPVENCSECLKATYVCEAGLCVACGEGHAYTECAVCGQRLSSDEQDFNGLCGYHYDRAMKDD